MTDRELLELAAKAAGLKVRCVGNGEPNGAYSFYAEPSQLWWNPLADDGDALRLAVALHLVIDTGGVTATRQKTYVGGHEGYLADESHGTDPYAATRRAIVRAAAEIGRSKDE